MSTHVLNNLEGCDSTLTLHLTINNSVFAGNDSLGLVCSNENPSVDLFSYIGLNYNPAGSWFDIDNTGALSGNVFSSNIVTQSSDYHFEYVVHGTLPCINDTAHVTLFVEICTGTDYNSSISTINIYPNPVKEELKIKISDSNSILNFKILNILGEVIYTSTIDKKATISTTHFPSGEYLIKLYSDKSTIIKKFVKE